MGKIKQKYKAGKTNYQQTLKTLLDEAMKHLRDSNLNKFTITVWETYSLGCNEKDREEIDELVAERIEDGKTKRVKNMTEFRRFVNSNPFSWQSYMFEGEYNMEFWYEIYNIMREALTIRYAGTKTTVKEDEMQDGLDEGPDQIPTEDFKGGDSYE